MNDPNTNLTDADLALLTAYLSGGLSISEETALRNRLESDQALRVALDELQELWNDAGDTRSIPEVDTRAALQTVKKRLTRSSETRIVRLSFLQRVAAVGLIAIAFTAVLYITSLPTEGKLLVTGEGERIEHVLKDGTKVVLDEHSELRVVDGFGKKVRKVEFIGRGYFDVQTDSSKAFIVDLAGVDVTVMGTAFEIASSSTHSRINVTEGRVKMATDIDPEAAIILEAGETGSWNAQLLKPLRQELSSSNIAAWATRTLTFRNTPMDSVASDLSEFFEMPIVIGQGSLEGCTLTTSFDDPDLEEVLNELKLLLSVETQIDKEVLIINGANCNE